VTTSSAARISAARIIADIAQEVVQEEATPDVYLPPGWTRTKLETGLVVIDSTCVASKLKTHGYPHINRTLRPRRLKAATSTG
jgi:hypothetical protein